MRAPGGLTAPERGCYCSGTMARLTLKLLGGFLLRADDRPRALPARKAQALLAYLAVRAGRAHARETLTGLLWGDVGQRQARQSLRQTMVRLRRVLAANPRALLAQGDTVTLTPAALDLDVSAFERLVRRGTPEALESAVALYRVRCSTACTSRRRPSRSGSTWSAPGSASWPSTRSAGSSSATARQDAWSRPPMPPRACSRSTPSRRRSIARSCACYVRQGRRAAALRQYQACVAILQKELGVEPEPQTKRLYLEILQRAAPAAGGRRGATLAAGRARRPRPTPPWSADRRS